MADMTLVKLFVLIGGLAAIAWVNWYFFLARRTAVSAAPDGSGTQQVEIAVAGGYSPAEVRVQAGRSVRLVFDRRETNPCSEEVVIPDFGIRRFLPPNQKTAVEFTPTRPGSYEFTCGMGMLRGKVVAE
jgi:plastocyanin domain-containing protein